MSQSPEQPDADDNQRRMYLKNWDTLGTLIRRGRSFSGHERNCCFLNLGRTVRADGTQFSPDASRTALPSVRFANVSAAAGFDLIDDSRGMATVDWDHDGDLDLWLSSRTAPGIRFLRNGVRTANQSIAFRLQGTSCNRDAIGARVELVTRTADGVQRRLVRTVRAGDAFASQATKWLHFGLVNGSSIQRVSVHWPGQAPAEHFALDQGVGRFRLIQGSGRATPDSSVPRSANSLVSRTPIQPPVSDRARVVLTRRRKLPVVEYVDFSATSGTSPGGRLDRARNSDSAPSTSTLNAGGSPLLLTLWASWCQPCLEELQSLRDHQEALENAGLQVLALSIDGVNDPKGLHDVNTAATRVRELDLKLPSGVASGSSLRALQQLLFDIFYRELPLQVPTSFLLDEQGDVSIVYRGRHTVQQWIDDARLIRLGNGQRIQSELYPLGGRSALGMLATDRLGFARAYFEGGYYEDAYRELMLYIEKAQRQLNASPAPALNRKLAEAHHELAKTLAALKRPEQAVRAHRAALQLMPNAIGSRISLATMLWQMGEYEEAETELKRAEQSAAGAASYYHLLGRTRMQFGQTSEAIKCFRRVLDEHPDNVQARLQLAVALAADGQTGVAIETYQRLLDENPNLISAANNLAWIRATHPHAEFRDGAEAVRLAESVCRQTNHNRPEYLDTLASAHAESGNFSKAAQIADNASAWARRMQLTKLAREITARANIYRRQQPYRTPQANHQATDRE